MTIKRYIADTARDALRRIKDDLGDDAVVISNKAVEGGVEIIAMSPERLRQLSQQLGADPTAVPRGDYTVSLSKNSRNNRTSSASNLGGSSIHRNARKSQVGQRSSIGGYGDLDESAGEDSYDVSAQHTGGVDHTQIPKPASSPPQSELALSFLSGTRAETISEEDYLDRGRLTESLVCLLTEREDCEPFAIGLFGHWGTGKSTQVNLLRKALEQRSRDGANRIEIKVAEFNAWKNEKADKLGAMLAQALVDRLVEGKSTFQRLRLAMQLSARRNLALRKAAMLDVERLRFRLYDNFVVLLPLATVASALAIAWLWFPADYLGWKAIATGALSSAGAIYLTGYRYIRDNLTDFFKRIGNQKPWSLLSLPDYSAHKGLLGEIHRTLYHLCSLSLQGNSPKEGPYLLLVVDDLDRCSISAVKEVFDAIRLVADIPRVVTLIAIDERIAYAAVEKHYEQFGHIGRDPQLVAREFLAKVLQLSITLPEIKQSDIEHFVTMTLFEKKEGYASDPESTKSVGTPEKLDVPFTNQISVSESAVTLSQSPIYSLPDERALFRELAKAFRFSNPRLLGRLHLAWKLLKSLSLEETYSMKLAEPLMRALFWREWYFQQDHARQIDYDQWLLSKDEVRGSGVTQRIAHSMVTMRGNAELLLHSFTIVDAVLLPGSPRVVEVPKRMGSSQQISRTSVSEPLATQDEAIWSDADAGVDHILGLEVGYRLIPLVEEDQGGELLRRIHGLRNAFAKEFGFLSAPVRISDNQELEPYVYHITLKGTNIGQGEAFPGLLLAINPGKARGRLPGVEIEDPTFGLKAIWIESEVRESAEAYGYTVVDASTVVATHLNHLMVRNAGKLLGPLEVQGLLDDAAKDVPRLGAELGTKNVTLAMVHQVLQNLLDEGVSIHEMSKIIETIGKAAGRIGDAIEMTAQVRIALGNSIVQGLYRDKSEVSVLVLDPNLERALSKGTQRQSEMEELCEIEPLFGQKLLRQIKIAAAAQEEAGAPAVLIVPGHLRWMLSRFLRRAYPSLHVLAFAEVPDDREVRVFKTIRVSAKPSNHQKSSIGRSLTDTMQTPESVTETGNANMSTSKPRWKAVDSSR